MKHGKQFVAAILLIGAAAGAGVAAERRHDRGPDRGPGSHRPEWRGEIHRFHDHDIELWRSGRWHHGRHDGRLGWWWIVAGIWYFYPAQVLPYPDPYQPPVVAPPPQPAPPQYWYYCPDPAGYYPYVAKCRVNWTRVPATPPPGN